MSFGNFSPNDTGTCLQSRDIQLLNTTVFVTKCLLLLPLYTLVIFVGIQRRRLQRSDASMSHSDFFMYNMVAVEMMSLVESALTCSLSYVSSLSLSSGSMYTFLLSFPGQVYYHCLTCVERYVAVVFPIIYMNLRRRSAVRIVRICSVTGCLLFTGCFLVMVMFVLESAHVLFLMTEFVAFAVVFFCSVSVLYTLKRPGPGDGDRANQSKQRAFYTIMAIIGVLFLWMMGALINFGLVSFGGEIYLNNYCLLFLSSVFFSLPTSLLLPLLFLHRVGKLPCCSYTSEQN